MLKPADGFRCENVLLLRLVAGPPAFVSFESIRRRRLMRPKLLLLALLIPCSLTAQAQHRFHVLHSFGAGHDGGGVWDSVAFDGSGNLYGTTSGGGSYSYGTAFELSPQSNGRWKETMLRSFRNGDSGGDDPNGGLTVAPSGELYGTTDVGGAYGVGTAFALVRGQHGWTRLVLHSFGGPGDYACCPWGNLIMGRDGKLYGTGGSAFEISRSPNGWTESNLHIFTGKNGDGFLPKAGPTMDAAGNLYGTTLDGGGAPLCADGCGTVWELQPPANDEPVPKAWTEHILHAFGFSDNDGVWPGVGQLAMDAEGNLYGTANGGKYRSGVVYKLARPTVDSGQNWQETILYNFTGGADGGVSEGVILDSAGNLYGAAAVGGSPSCGCGVVFKLSPHADGSWKYTLLHTFVGSDGAEPDANLTLGPDGKLYGTAATGGTFGGGVVFQLTP